MSVSITVRRVLLSAVLLGVLVGAAVAFASRAQSPAAPRRSATPSVRFASPDGPARQGDPVHEVRGPITLPVRVPDPDGGPAWAVRLVESRTVITRPRRVAYRSSWARCAQLGRIVGGRFGWVTGARGFRPVAPTDVDGVPHVCLTQRRLAGRAAATSLITVLGTTARGEVVPARTIAFGRTGPDLTGITLMGRGRPVLGARRGDAFLTFGPPDPGFRDLRLRITFRHARPINRDLADMRGTGPTIGRQDRPVAGQERIVVRTPDPAGGPPFGIVAAPGRRPGEWCPAQIGRIVGRRGGVVDLGLQIFRAGSRGFACPNATHPLTRRSPLELSVETFRGRADSADAGRVQRRSLPGSTVIAGRAHRDVRTVEVATSRDVRTLQPDPLTGSFVTAYDGEFPREDITLTARFADGTSVPITIPHSGA